MKNAIKVACLALLNFSMVSWACSPDGLSGFLPPNKLSIPPDVKNVGLAREEFETLIKQFAAHYTPIARSYGGNLKLKGHWESSRVNAGTYRSGNDNVWHINLYGGFARHPSITKDGLMLVLCHEMGHHIGGGPKKTRFDSIKWSSNEGQADYFATLKCLRSLFVQDDNRRALKGMEIPSKVRNQCQDNFSFESDRNLCIRTSMAGLAVARVMADSQESAYPTFETPDLSEVAETLEGHPNVQCRLDTYLMGSVCEVNYNIPLSQINEYEGTCHSYWGHREGMRPLCWFREARL